MTSSLGMLAQIGATAHPAGRRPAWSCCTTSRRSCGSQRCRRPRRSPLPRPSTTQHRWLAARSCISGRFCTVSDLRRRSLPRELAKHIDIQKHFAHEIIQNGPMRLVEVSNSAQLAHILTKGLHLPQVQMCVEGILGRKKIRGPLSSRGGALRVCRALN